MCKWCDVCVSESECVRVSVWEWVCVSECVWWCDVCEWCVCVCESECVWVSVCDDVMCVSDVCVCVWVMCKWGESEWVSECEWVCESEWVCVSVWVSDVCEWEGGRRSGGRSGAALKTKTPHANVGKKQYIRHMWKICSYIPSIVHIYGTSLVLHKHIWVANHACFLAFAAASKLLFQLRRTCRPT